MGPDTPHTHHIHTPYTPHTHPIHTPDTPHTHHIHTTYTPHPYQYPYRYQYQYPYPYPYPYPARRPHPTTTPLSTRCASAVSNLGCLRATARSVQLGNCSYKVLQAMPDIYHYLQSMTMPSVTFIR